jgi:hypothetical protein
MGLWGVAFALGQINGYILANSQIRSFGRARRGKAVTRPSILFFVRVGLLATACHDPKLTKTSKDARQCSHKALEIRNLLVQDGVSEQ